MKISDDPHLKQFQAIIDQKQRMVTPSRSTTQGSAGNPAFQAAVERLKQSKLSAARGFGSGSHQNSIASSTSNDRVGNSEKITRSSSVRSTGNTGRVLSISRGDHTISNRRFLTGEEHLGQSVDLYA